MSRQIVQVRPHTRADGQIDVDAHQRAAVTGPNTRWLAPSDANDPPAALLGPVPPGVVVYDPAFTSHENSGSEEYATPVSRAHGQVIRLLPFSFIWLLLTGGLVWLFGLSFPYLLVGFAVLTAATYWRMNLDEFDHSRNGLERHKVDSAVAVRLAEMQQSHELRKMALEGYLRQLEGGRQQ